MTQGAACSSVRRPHSCRLLLLARRGAFARLFNLAARREVFGQELNDETGSGADGARNGTATSPREKEGIMSNQTLLPREEAEDALHDLVYNAQRFTATTRGGLWSRC